jgi:hypothetical protein
MIRLTYFVHFKSVVRPTRQRYTVHLNYPEEALWFMQRALEANANDPAFRIGRGFAIEPAYD